jgi:heterodisulfide reductase subunit B
VRYAYYPGCSLQTSAKEYDLSLRAVCNRLGIELVELKNWNCCGATPAFTVDPLLAIGLSARNLALAEGEDLSIIVAPCTACYKNLRKAGKALEEDPELRERVNDMLTEHNKLDGIPTVKLPLEVIASDFDLDTLEVERPLTGLNVACYYGCPIARPKGSFDNREAPQAMHLLVEKLGGQPVPFVYDTKCCGGGIVFTREEISRDLTAKLLTRAQAAGADCLIAMCPLCHLMLDAYQSQIERRLKTRFDLPVFYFTQLMGLALGLGREELGLERNMVSPFRLLERMGLKV